MKKLFKYLGISLASLLLITAIGLYIFYSMYKNWEGFVNASERNDISQMQEILNQGFDINQTLMQVSPLFVAVSYSHINYETIKFMLDNGADVNAKSHSRFSADTLRHFREASGYRKTFFRIRNRCFV